MRCASQGSLLSGGVDMAACPLFEIRKHNAGPAIGDFFFFSPDMDSAGYKLRPEEISVTKNVFSVSKSKAQRFGPRRNRPAHFARLAARRVARQPDPGRRNRPVAAGLPQARAPAQGSRRHRANYRSTFTGGAWISAPLRC